MEALVSPIFAVIPVVPATALILSIKFVRSDTFTIDAEIAAEPVPFVPVRVNPTVPVAVRPDNFA